MGYKTTACSSQDSCLGSVYLIMQMVLDVTRAAQVRGWNEVTCKGCTEVVLGSLISLTMVRLLS